jgi:aminoglycoside phosphotransferase (APT) family kinase protein
VPDTASLDPRAILASIGINDAAEVEPVHGGADTAIWRVRRGDRLYALRVFRPEQAPACEGEVLAMRYAAANHIPVPEVIEKGMWENRPVLLISWLPGTTLFEELRKHLHRTWTLGKAFGRTHAAIHTIIAPPDVESTSWIEWAGEDQSELKARLHELKSRQSRLIHLDYHPLNVMVDGSRISGVLDWTNVHAGDPRADFARTEAILRIAPWGLNLPIRIRFLRWALERAWHAGYIEAAGKLEDMALFRAWAGASMVDEYARRVGNPNFGLEDHHLDPVRNWRDTWKHRAGLPV